jgi:CHAT domain-containing protein
MEEFYKRLWDAQNPLSPGEALRQAQLTVLHHPQLVIARAQKLRAELVQRGAPAEGLELRGIRKVLARLPEGGRVDEQRRAPTQWWAGFVLSGDGTGPDRKPGNRKE